MKTFSFPTFRAAALAVAAFVGTANGQVQVAGTLLINVDPSTVTPAPVAWVTNSGSLGGVFQATGLAAVDQPLVVNVGGGAKGLVFDGHNFMEHVAAPGGAAVSLSTTPLAGNNAPCSIECWVLNPATWNGDGETMVSWGVRGAGGNMMVFSYSANVDHGATDHWAYNLGWNGVPTLGVWHHLVYTFDGATQKIYVDGTLNRSGAANYNPVATQPVTLACQREPNGALIGWGWVRGSLTLGRVRIHSGPLSDAQVAQNYNLEKSAFVVVPTPLTAKPIHRYTFNGAATNDAVGLLVTDAGAPGGADGVVQGTYGTASAGFNGTKLSLSGGASDLAPYVDLPNGLISSLSAVNGGSGQLTVEGWVTVTGGQNWPRLFDFGSTTSGEIPGPGGVGNGGQNYFMLAQVNVYRDWAQCAVNNHGFNGGPNVSSWREFGYPNDNIGGIGAVHFAVSWNEATGEINVYENGVLATRFSTQTTFSQVDDVNCWLGRSGWLTDGNLQGEYDEFRIYNRVLTAAEVINDFQAGADVVAVEPGPLQAIYLTLPRTNTMVDTFVQAIVTADFLNVSNLNVTAAAGIVYTSSDESVATVSVSGKVLAVGEGAATITAALGGKSDAKSLVVVPITADLTHRYSFNDPPGSLTAFDSEGGATANVYGWPGLTGTKVELDRLSLAFVQLPGNIITNGGALTLEAWSSFGPNDNWARLYDFGDTNPNGEGRYYFMGVPHSGNGTAWISLADADPGWRHEQPAERPGVLDNQANVHFVAVYHPYAGYMALYINGILGGINTNFTTPLSVVSNTLCYLGKSLYNNDPYLNGSIDEFRIYDGVLTQDKIAINAAAGPDQIIGAPGPLQSVTLVTGNQVVVGVTQQAAFTGNFASVLGVNLFAYGQPTITSGNPNILTVSSAGLMRGVAPGTTTVVASYGGLSATNTVTVIIQPPVLTHRYPFNEAVGLGSAADIVGGSQWPGTLNGNAQFTGSELSLDGANTSFVSFPPNMFNGYFALTVEAWVSFGANNWWCRLFDFGDQTAGGTGNTSIFFSPHGGPEGIEMTMLVPGRNDHIGLRGFLDGQTNLHLTCVYNPPSGWYKLYYNGRLVGQINNASIPISAVNTLNAWIGRSQWNSDPGLNATINEFRVYDGALGPEQIAVDNATGPNSIITSVGALQSVELVLNTLMFFEQSQRVRLLGDFANVADVNLFNYGSPTLTSSNPNVVAVEDAAGLVRAVGIGTAVLTANYDGTIKTATVTVTTPLQALEHRYTFSDASGSLTALDSVGTAHGMLNGGASFDGAGKLILDGTDGYVTLPAGIISSLSNLTIQAWVTANPVVAGIWPRVFDFGTDDGAGVGLNFMFLSASGAPGVRFQVSTPLAPYTPELNAPGALPIGQQSHVAITYNVSGGVATLYLNGVAVASGTIVSPLAAINDLNNWLGRSQYASDGYFAATYDEFRIFEGSLLPGEIAASYAAGPNSLPIPSLQVEIAGSNVLVSKPSWAARYVLESRAALDSGPSWSVVPSGEAVNDGSSLVLTLPGGGSAQFFRLRF
jgi:hypothetical protein